MPMPKLIITEKPSVARSIAHLPGAAARRDGYLEGNGGFVSWCVGHLVELAQPGQYDQQYAKWQIADLPILPRTWQYNVSPSTRKQFEVLRSLMARPDVERLVCATDAGQCGWAT